MPGFPRAFGNSQLGERRQAQVTKTESGGRPVCDEGGVSEQIDEGDQLHRGEHRSHDGGDGESGKGPPATNRQGPADDDVEAERQPHVERGLGMARQELQPNHEREGGQRPLAAGVEVNLGESKCPRHQRGDAGVRPGQPDDHEGAGRVCDARQRGGGGGGLEGSEVESHSQAGDEKLCEHGQAEAHGWWKQKREPCEWREHSGLVAGKKRRPALRGWVPQRQAARRDLLRYQFLVGQHLEDRVADDPVGGCVRSRLG